MKFDKTHRNHFDNLMQNQTISILYQDETYDVDYSKLHDASNKFREMIKPYIDSGVNPQNLQLRILYDKFTPRNVSNFLKIIQNKKNDVHSHEIAEICEISKLFQAEKLYNKSMLFVHNRVDPNFTITNDFNESNGQKYLELEELTNLSTQFSYSTNNIESNNINSPVTPTPTVNYSKSQESLPEKDSDLHNNIYKIQILNPVMKCCRYFFSHDGRILYTAKKKTNEIYIGQGNNIHISNESESCARIMQCDGYNIVYTNDQEIKITYIPFGPRNQYSLETSFVHEGRTLFWSPRQIDAALNGVFNRVPMQSRKNMLLKNNNGAPTFLVRKMEDEVFEVECLSTVNTLVAFAIGLSQIIGPF